MQKIAILVLILISNFIFSQNSFSLQSEENNAPIQYAKIFVNNNYVATTDAIGVFVIDEKYLNETVSLFAIGYKPTKAHLTNNNTVIKMETQRIELNEVIVVEKKTTRLKQYKVGKLKNGDKGIVCEKEKSTATHLAKFFPNNYKGITYLEKIRFKAISHEENRIIAIYIYNLDSKGLPNEILNTKNLICYVKKGHNVNEIDVSNLNLKLPENGIYITFNYLLLEQNKQYGQINKNWFYYEPSMDALDTEQFEDTYYFKDNTWVKAEGYSIVAQLIVSNQ